MFVVDVAIVATGDMLLADGVVVIPLVLAVSDCFFVIFDVVLVAVGDILLADGVAVLLIVLVVGE